MGKNRKPATPTNGKKRKGVTRPTLVISDSVEDVSDQDIAESGQLGKNSRNGTIRHVYTTNSEMECIEDYLKPVYKDGEVILEVECGSNKAMMYLSKLCQGSKGPCVEFQGSWLTPNEFQYVSGRETAKDWKRSIRHQGKSMKLLLTKGVLSVHSTVCDCEGCRVTSPVNRCRLAEKRRSVYSANRKERLTIESFTSCGTSSLEEISATLDTPSEENVGNCSEETPGFTLEKKIVSKHCSPLRESRLSNIIEQLRSSKEKSLDRTTYKKDMYEDEKRARDENGNEGEEDTDLEVAPVGSPTEKLAKEEDEQEKLELIANSPMAVENNNSDIGDDDLAEDTTSKEHSPNKIMSEVKADEESVKQQHSEDIQDDCPVNEDPVCESYPNDVPPPIKCSTKTEEKSEPAEKGDTPTTDCDKLIESGPPSWTAQTKYVEKEVKVNDSPKTSMLVGSQIKHHLEVAKSNLIKADVTKSVEVTEKRKERRSEKESKSKPSSVKKSAAAAPVQSTPPSTPCLTVLPGSVPEQLFTGDMNGAKYSDFIRLLAASHLGGHMPILPERMMRENLQTFPMAPNFPGFPHPFPSYPFVPSPFHLKDTPHFQMPQMALSPPFIPPYMYRPFGLMPHPLAESCEQAVSPSQEQLTPKRKESPPPRKRGPSETDSALDLSTKRSKLDESYSKTAHYLSMKHNSKRQQSFHLDTSSPKHTRVEKGKDPRHPTLNSTLKSYNKPNSHLYCTCSKKDDIRQWSLNEVVRFLHTLDGCSAYADTFQEQRIDGKSLPLLTVEHLMHNIGMKLGPAVLLTKTVAKRLKAAKQSQNKCPKCESISDWQDGQSLKLTTGQSV